MNNRSLAFVFHFILNAPSPRALKPQPPSQPEASCISSPRDPHSLSCPFLCSPPPFPKFPPRVFSVRLPYHSSGPAHLPGRVGTQVTDYGPAVKQGACKNPDDQPCLKEWIPQHWASLPTCRPWLEPEGCCPLDGHTARLPGPSAAWPCV